MIPSIPKARVVGARTQLKRMLTGPHSQYRFLNVHLPKLERLAASPRRQAVCEVMHEKPIALPLYEMGLATAFDRRQIDALSGPLADAIATLVPRLGSITEPSAGERQGYFCLLAVRSRKILADGAFVSGAKFPEQHLTEVERVLKSHDGHCNISPTDYTTRMGELYDDLLIHGAEFQLVRRWLEREDKLNANLGCADHVIWSKGFGIPRRADASEDVREYVLVMNLLGVLEVLCGDYASRALVLQATTDVSPVSHMTRGWATAAARVLDAVTAS